MTAVIMAAFASPVFAYGISPNPPTCTLSSTTLSCDPVTSSGGATRIDGFFLIQMSGGGYTNVLDVGSISTTTYIGPSFDYSELDPDHIYNCNLTGVNHICASGDDGATDIGTCGDVTGVGYGVTVGTADPPSFAGYTDSALYTTAISGICAPPDFDDPVATIITPDDSVDTPFIEEPTINATGASPYYFVAATDVSNSNAGITGVMETQILGEDGTTVICAMTSGVSDSNADGANHYGGKANIFVDGDPSPCAPLGISSPTKHYSVRARFTLTQSGTTYATGDWSEPAIFVVVPVGFVPPIDCSIATGVRNDITCAVQGLVSFLFVPSQSSITGVFSALSGFSGRWPISWISDFYNALIEASTVTPDSLGSIDGGTITTAPNMAWFSSKMQSFYGDWIGGGFIAAIWIGTALSIAKTGLALLGVETVENDDTS